MKSRILSVCYFLILFLFALYSYSQIDLNLTISSNELYQNFQSALISLGYFNRPFSSLVFVVLLLSLFAVYLMLLKVVMDGEMKLKQVVKLIIGGAVILIFSYPAFSHDIFNYMFDARIVTKYFSNPYIHKALDYPNDLWTRFMRWTHRTYPYGPVWLLITIPLSFMGFGKFTLTLFFFRLMFFLFYLGNVYLIFSIMKKLRSKEALLAAVFFGLNPLVVIESLLSPHNESVMLFFLFLSIRELIVRKNQIRAIFHFVLSIGVKFATIFVLPVFIFQRFFSKKFHKMKILRILFIFTGIAIAVEILYREPYPWYFLLLFGVGSLLISDRKLMVFQIILSIGVLFHYLPFLYFGQYDTQIYLMQNMILILTLTAAFFGFAFTRQSKKQLQ